MKALTIHPPWSHLIVTPAEELKDGDVPKRIENRCWATDYRGDLLIHAGKSRSWLREGDDARYPEMLYGYVVGIARLVDCVANTGDRYEFLKAIFGDWSNSHADPESPFWWILDDVERFPRPVKMRGQQKLWECPGNWVRPSAKLACGGCDTNLLDRRSYEKPKRQLRLKGN